MAAYTKEQFEEYKANNEYLSVGYEYPRGNWEWIEHKTYEDYINIFSSYVSMYKVASPTSVEK